VSLPKTKPDKASAPVDEPPTAAPPTPDEPRATLWKHPDFLRLWAGQSLAMLGAQVGRVALPIVAVVMLNADAAQMGLLSALSQLPFLLFLFAGVWADRVRRRQAMIWTDLGRFVLLGAIPLLYLADRLTMAWLLALAFVIGVLGVMFEVAYQAYLPSLVGREHLGEGNQKLQLSNSMAQIAGPSAAGLLVTAVTSALVLVTSAFTYLASALLVLFIRRPESAPTHDGPKQSVVAAIGAGLRWVLGHRVLRPIVIAVSLFMFFNTALQTLYVLYLIRDLDVPVGWVGAIYAAAGPGAMIGAWAALRMMKKHGLGKSIVWSTVVANGSLLLVPLAGGPLWLVVALLALSQFVFGLAAQVAVVNQTTLRMVLTPDNLQGRVAATFRAISLGMVPVGALIAGLLAEAIGLREMVLIAAIGVLLPLVALFASPIPRIASFPSEEESAAWAPRAAAPAAS
jgi:MFS family permease